jgi:hypothetical protein
MHRGQFAATIGLSLVVSVCAAAPPRSVPPPISQPLPARPQPAPAGFSARDMGNGTVNLNWQAVPGANAYHLDGAGIDPRGINLAAPATSMTLTGVPAGIDAWHVAALYSTALGTPATASAIVRVLPAHPMPWLTKPNGPGNPAANFAHYLQFCPGTALGSSCFPPLQALVAPTMWMWGDTLDQAQYGEAVYGNTGDLGFGRRTNCAQQFNGPPGIPIPGLYTVCYATNHGNLPGGPGFDVASFITRAAAGEDPIPPASFPPCGSKYCFKNPWGSLPDTVSVIVKGPLGFTFMSMSMGQPILYVDPGDGNYGGAHWFQIPDLVQTVILDSEGPKHQPHACLACHGGYYDTATGRVQGATLLPIDPAMVAFPTTQPGDRVQYERPFQEENIRRINSVVLFSGPSQAVADYITGLYPAGVSKTGSLSQTDFVPVGWTDAAGLYRTIVKPYCATCHLAAPANLNFASFGNFMQNRDLIYSAVCQQKTMPHAEIPFRNFWTKDTGVVYLPGVLATGLGYSSCP